MLSLRVYLKFYETELSITVMLRAEICVFLSKHWQDVGLFLNHHDTLLFLSLEWWAFLKNLDNLQIAIVWKRDFTTFLFQFQNRICVIRSQDVLNHSFHWKWNPLMKAWDFCDQKRNAHWLLSSISCSWRMKKLPLATPANEM